MFHGDVLLFFEGESLRILDLIIILECMSKRKSSASLHDTSIVLVGYLLGLVFWVLPLSAIADGHGLLFIDVIAVSRNSESENVIAMKEENDVLPRTALFYANDFGSIRILGEYIIEEEETRLGRFKFGWEPDDSNILWFGRTHNPSSYWRDQYHHGGWLQPTINRPGITDFEFSGGVLPVISTGMAFEGGGAVTNLIGWSYVVNLGITSVLGADGLEAPSLSETDPNIHSTSFSSRLSYKFDSYSGGDEFGVFVSNNHIANKLKTGEEYEQLVLGFFINWNISDLRLTSEVYSVTNELENNQTVAGVTEDFQNAYIMLDYILDDNWNTYARYEDTAGEEKSQYLSNFPMFVLTRSLLGVRYNINRNQTVKFEVEKNELISGEEYSQISAQWNFVYP